MMRCRSPEYNTEWMMNVIINKQSEVPLYIQLKEYIKGCVMKGNLSPGSRVESEFEISEKFQISRITVRKAYSELVDEGYLVRKRGKGTFIRDIHYKENLASNSFTSTCTSLGLVPGSKIVRSGMITVPTNLVGVLGVSKGALIPYIERLRFADDIPVRLERNYYAPKYEGLLKENLESSIRKILLSKYGLKDDTRISFEIEIGYTNREESALLGTKLKAPMLKVKGTLFDNMGDPVYHTEMLHLPDRCVLMV